MKIFLTLFFAAFTVATYAQKEIKLAELKDHIGESVKVQGIISGVSFLENSKNRPTFIGVGDSYSNQLLTVVILGDVRSQFVIIPSAKDAGNKIIVSGKVELYKQKLQIIIKDIRQLEIVQDAQGDQQ